MKDTYILSSFGFIDKKIKYYIDYERKNYIKYS